MLNLNRWAIFATAAELKSFSKAAEHLATSKPTISKQISALEEELGTKLFLRSTRHLQLTEAGKALYTHCEVIMREYYNAEGLLDHMRETPCGELHISAPTSYIQKLLTTLSIRFLEEYPEITLNFHTKQLSKEYFPKDVDIAVIVNKLKDSDLCYRKLGEAAHVLCASPDYIAKKGSPKSIQDLKNYNYVQANYAHISPDAEWGATLNGNYEKIEMDGNIKADNSLVIKHMVREGAGITSLPTFLVSDDIAQGKLIQLLPKYVVGTTPFYAVFPEKKYMPPKVRAYIDFLVEFFENNPQFH